MDERRFRAAVVGAGPTGIAAALALGLLGVETALIGPPHRPRGCEEDRRTAALFAGSIELLRNLGVWPAIAGACEPIAAIRIVDDRNALLRAPEVLFPAAEIGLEALGFNVPNAALVTALHEKARESESNVVRIETRGVTRLDFGADTVLIARDDGPEIETELVVAADGRRSLCREAAGIPVHTWTYTQSALVATFAHERPHRRISTEFHRPAGPLTTVPLPGLASSLVWVDEPPEAERLSGIGDDAFRSSLEARLQGLLGSVGAIGPRAVFPLAGLQATLFARDRIALVGEAAHAMPPIGAQGLNLGLRDVAALADCMADAIHEHRDLGAPGTLAAFTAARRLDIASRIASVDLLNRSLTSSLLPFHLARGIGLHALNAIGPLRRLVMREGLEPSHVKASLLQPAGNTELMRRAGLIGKAAA